MNTVSGLEQEKRDMQPRSMRDFYWAIGETR